MNTSIINQEAINKALWAACDTFRGTVSADTYKDFILTGLTRNPLQWISRKSSE